MGRTTAREKVGSFLLKMMERTSDQPTGLRSRAGLLTSRYDIADYLALFGGDCEPFPHRTPDDEASSPLPVLGA